MKKFFSKPFNVILLAIILVVYYRCIARPILDRNKSTEEVSVLGDGSDSSGITETNAYVIAKDFVKDNIDTPSTAEFPGEYSTRKIGANRWEVSGDVDAQNGFGAMKRAKFFVELEYNGGEWTDKNNWTLINFDLKQ